MELGQFISNALVGVAHGIRTANTTLRSEREANESLHSAFFTMGPVNQTDKQASIEFDVAVTVSTTASGSANAGGSLLKVVELSGKASAEHSHQNASRIKFTVWVPGQLI
jgi:hypothetical protein